jgi:predicted double-glycine peptidase
MNQNIQINTEELIIAKNQTLVEESISRCQTIRMNDNSEEFIMINSDQRIKLTPYEQGFKLSFENLNSEKIPVPKNINVKKYYYNENNYVYDECKPNQDNEFYLEFNEMKMIKYRITQDKKFIFRLVCNFTIECFYREHHDLTDELKK